VIWQCYGKVEKSLGSFSGGDRFMCDLHSGVVQLTHPELESGLQIKSLSALLKRGDRYSPKNSSN
jgi:hypothetical protein